MSAPKLCLLVMAVWLPGASIVAAAGLADNTMAAEPRATPQYFESHEPESEEQQRARKTADMEAWLRRLVGRFWVEPPAMEKFVEGIFPNMRRPVGIVDCVGIGAGAGVHCIFYSPKSAETWKEWASANANGEKSADEPLRRDEVLKVSSVVEYGLDPNAARIRMMVAEERSAQQVAGVLSNDTVASWTRCWNSPALPPCDVGQLIDAPADNGDVGITYVHRFIRLRYVLHRMSRDEAVEAGRQIEAAQLEVEGRADDHKSNSGSASSAPKNRSRPR